MSTLALYLEKQESVIERQNPTLLNIPMIDLVIDPTKKEKTVDFRDDCEVLSSSSSSDTEAKKIIVPPTEAMPKHRKVRQEET